MRQLTPKDLKWLEQTFAKLHDNVTILYFTEAADCPHCRHERELLTELTDLSHKLHLEVYNVVADREEAEKHGVDKVPGVVLIGKQDYGVRYYGMPSNFEFRMLLEDVQRISSGNSGLSEQLKQTIATIDSPCHLEVITTPACPFTESAVRLAHQMAMESDYISADLVDVDDFPELATRYNVRAAPTVVVNGKHCFYGALSEFDFVSQIIEAAKETET